MHDGYVLQKTVLRSPLAGALLTKCMLKAIQSKGTNVRPRQTFKRVDNGDNELKVGNSSRKGFGHFLNTRLLVQLVFLHNCRWHLT